MGFDEELFAKREFVLSVRERRGAKHALLSLRAAEYGIRHEFVRRPTGNYHALVERRRGERGEVRSWFVLTDFWTFDFCVEHDDCLLDEDLGRVCYIKGKS